jgi:hypothetical protein
MPTQPTYTELPGDRRFKQIAWGSGPLPPCQAPYIDWDVSECDKPGEYDSPTVDGPWADLCDNHAEQFCPKNTSIGFHRIKR